MPVRMIDENARPSDKSEGCRKVNECVLKVPPPELLDGFSCGTDKQANSRLLLSRQMKFLGSEV